MIGSFTYYVDRTDGYFVFTCWNETNTSCGVHSVPAERGPNNIKSLETNRINRTARNERLNYQTGDWEKSNDIPV